jgi:hypothetical protein
MSGRRDLLRVPPLLAFGRLAAAGEMHGPLRIR